MTVFAGALSGASAGALTGDALVIGIAQSSALIAGISRDGVCMTAGLARGLSHETAARFAFLLATPVILAAGLFKLPDFLGAPVRASAYQPCSAWSLPPSARSCRSAGWCAGSGPGRWSPSPSTAWCSASR